MPLGIKIFIDDINLLWKAQQRHITSYSSGYNFKFTAFY